MLGIGLYPTQAGVKAAVDPAVQFATASHNWTMEIITTRHGDPVGISGISNEPLAGVFGNTFQPRTGHQQYSLGYTPSDLGAPRGRILGNWHSSIHDEVTPITSTPVVTDVAEIVVLKGTDDGGFQRVTLYRNGAQVDTDMESDTQFGEYDPTGYFSVGGALLEAGMSAYWNVYATIAHASLYDVALSDARILTHAQAAGLA